MGGFCANAGGDGSMSQIRKRRLPIVLAALLLVTLIAAYLAPPAQTATLPPVARVIKPDTRVAETPSSGAMDGNRMTIVLKVKDRNVGEEEMAPTGLFAVPAPPPPPAPPPEPKKKTPVLAPPPPQAPPLPFQVLGRYVEDGKTAVFLRHHDRNLVVRVGDTLAGQYKVESLDGNLLTLRYLPLDQMQTLLIGAAN